MFALALNALASPFSLGEITKVESKLCSPCVSLGQQGISILENYIANAGDASPHLSCDDVISLNTIQPSPPNPHQCNPHQCHTHSQLFVPAPFPPVGSCSSAGVVGGCAKVCDSAFKTNQIEREACSLLCDVVGIKVFVAALNKTDRAHPVTNLN